MKILYVEDNAANVFLVKRIAKVGGHDVVNYIDGEEALGQFESDKPDLVLMDIQLAGELSGLDVVHRLRTRGTRVPIIAVTAYAMVGDRERCLAAGCDDYLAKPLPIPRLMEIFDHYAKTPQSQIETLEVGKAQEIWTEDEGEKAQRETATPVPVADVNVAMPTPAESTASPEASKPASDTTASADSVKPAAAENTRDKPAAQ